MLSIMKYIIKIDFTCLFFLKYGYYKFPIYICGCITFLMGNTDLNHSFPPVLSLTFPTFLNFPPTSHIFGNH